MIKLIALFTIGLIVGSLAVTQYAKSQPFIKKPLQFINPNLSGKTKFSCSLLESANMTVGNNNNDSNNLLLQLSSQEQLNNQLALEIEGDKLKIMGNYYPNVGQVEPEILPILGNNDNALTAVLIHGNENNNAFLVNMNKTLGIMSITLILNISDLILNNHVDYYRCTGQ